MCVRCALRMVGMIAINCGPSFKWQINKIQFDSNYLRNNSRKTTSYFDRFREFITSAATSASAEVLSTTVARSPKRTLSKCPLSSKSWRYSDAKLLIREISLKKRFAIPDKDDNSWRGRLAFNETRDSFEDFVFFN